MNADDIGNERVDEMAQIVVRRLKEEPLHFRRNGKPLYLVFSRGGGNYIRKVPHIEPSGTAYRDIAYKLIGVPGGPGEMHYIVSPVDGRRGGSWED